MIRVVNLVHGVLDIPELTLSPGITAVAGDNGAGKTTFLRICAGIVLPDAGKVTLDGISPQACEVGYVSEFPDRHLIFSLVRDEIASPLRFSYKNPDEITAAVADISQAVGIEDLLDRSCRTLSGGEKMLVGLATALAAGPSLLVLDEPDSHLDPETAAEIFQLVQRSGCSHVLWSTYSRSIQSSADRVLLLASGQVVSR